MTKPRSGHFSIIPTDAVFDPRLSHADVRVLAALGAHANKERRCWPAVSTIAELTGMSERHAHRSLQTLAKCSYVEIERRAGKSSVYQIPMTRVSGVMQNPCHGGQGGMTRVSPDPGHGCHTNSIKNNTKNNYAFVGQIIRLTQANFDTWAKAYPNIDLGAQLQALDDYYDRNLTGGDRNKWFARCSQALAKRNERARAGQGQQREEPRFNDGVY